MAGTAMLVAQNPEAPAGVGEIESADETEYADEPYWYKPGHPLLPAEATSIRTLPGFVVERVLTVLRDWGSWTALTVDGKGRLIAAGQHEPGLYRITVPPPGEAGVEVQVEKLGGSAARIGWSHGLHWAFDSLYVTVAEGNDSLETGLYRLRDTDGDDQYDELIQMIEFNGGGEHGPHNVTTGPDGKSLYIMCGNGTALPEAVEKRRPVATDGTDHLMPPGFESSKHTTAGWVARFDPEGKDWELVCSGLRNSYDLAFNRAGDLFTFDSDMEWDLGAPWYRPARICHLVSGAEFGWRPDAAIWPEYFEDSVPPVANVGPASPTGIVFGYGAKFPAKYEKALFVCDWTFATIHAIHLEPSGSGYRAEVEEFLGGRGLPLTDIVIGADGAMYFVVGGRRLGSALYRVYYAGDEPVGQAALASEKPEWHLQRRALETLHGEAQDSEADLIWKNLEHPDRGVRFAARVALESQPVEGWRERALRGPEGETGLGALLALARQGDAADQRQVLERLVGMSWQRLSDEERLRALRIAELALARGGDEVDESKRRLKAWLKTAFPATDIRVNRELARLLCYLGDASAIDPLLDLMAADEGDRPPLGGGYFLRNTKYGVAVRDMLESAPRIERMHHAQMLLWMEDGWAPEQRKRYFALISEALAASKGGHQYREFWDRIREIALNRIPKDEREAYETSSQVAVPLADGLPVPKGPGRAWTLDEALEAVAQELDNGDPDNGRSMFSAAGCVVCHRFRGEGGASGPDLSALGQRFTLRDVLEAIIHPDRVISDQYRVVLVETTGGDSKAGLVISRDENVTRLAPDIMRPGRSIDIPNKEILKLTPVPVSTMPSGLLNALNEEELRDLSSYLMRP